MATRPDNWEAVKALFEAALEKDSAHRSSFLNERFRDASVRAEVERLLHEASAVFDAERSTLDYGQCQLVFSVLYGDRGNFAASEHAISLAHKNAIAARADGLDDAEELIAECLVSGGTMRAVTGDYDAALERL